jgi:hypothetical protein
MKTRGSVFPGQALTTQARPGIRAGHALAKRPSGCRQDQREPTGHSLKYFLTLLHID